MDKTELFPVTNFNQNLARLNEFAQNVTHENFVMIQKIQADILNDYTTGVLSDFEKRTLYNVATIVMREMRKALSLEVMETPKDPVAQSDIEN